MSDMQALESAPTIPTLHRPLHSKVTNYLNDQRKNGQFCDLLLDLDAMETPFAMHFCVVAAQSDFVAKTGGCTAKASVHLPFSINSPLKITINNFNCLNCLSTMIDFFYEDIITIAKEHEEHFKTLIKILAVSELMTLFGIDPNDCEEGNSSIRAFAQVVDPETLLEKNYDQTFEIDKKVNYFKVQNHRAHDITSNNKLNYCIGCDFKSYRAHDMIEHMGKCEASHLTCSLCEIGFLDFREFDAHLQTHSLDVKKPFFCMNCELRFVTRGAFTAHIPKHSTETPHRCKDCGKGFKWKHGLVNHMLIHSKERLMLCDVCGYSTIHMKALKSHKLKHNTDDLFKCTFPGCKHQANRKENLKLHFSTHTQQQPFVCEICGCKFSQSKNLKRHALKHSTDDVRRFTCQLCPTFSSHRSDKLKEHMQRVHTEKAILLELPETVDNAFEVTVKDEFNLPVIQMGTPKKSARKVRTKKKKVPPKNVTSVKPLKPILPKTIITPYEGNEGPPLNEPIFQIVL